MSDATKNIRRRDCVKLSNKIIERCKLPIPRVTSIDGIRSNLFTSLLEILYHRLPDEIIAEPASTEDEVSNVQSIINHLSLDLIHIDLSHISGADVIAGEPRAIYNLLEIFCGLHKYLSSTSIGKWNLDASLTETDSELSSQPSSEESNVGGGLDQEEAEEEEDGADSAPPPTLSRTSSAVARGSAARVPSAGSLGAARSASAARVRSSASGVGRVPSAGSAGRPASGGRSAARVPSGVSAGRAPSGVSAGRVPSGVSAGKAVSGTGSVVRVPSGGSAARVPSGVSAGKVPSTGSAARVPSGSSATRVSSSGSAARMPSGGASATKIASRASAGRVSAHSSATRVPSSGSGVGRVPSSGSGIVRGRSSSSGPLPGSSVSAGGEAEASLLPSSESGPVPAVRRSVSSGGGSGGAGAAGSSGAGAEPSSEGLGTAMSRTSQQAMQETAAGLESSEDGASPLRAPSGAGQEFAGLGRSSATRPSVGGLPADGDSGLQLTGSIDHHHYHHYDGEESGESSQLTELTADTAEEQEEHGYGSDEEEEDSERTEERTADTPELTRPESDASSQPQWELSEPEEDGGLLDSPEEEDGPGEDEDEGEEEEDGDVDVSRQISEEMQQLRETASSTEPGRRLSTTEQKRSVSAFKREPCESRDTESREAMQRDGGGGGRHGEWSSRRELSAPGRRSSAARDTRRAEDYSSASEPGLGGRSAARLPTRNVETIAEIRETGVERAITETTRQQAGGRLEKETVRREVRRKVSSAPPTRQMSYSKQATRRSVCSDGVTDWLESQADDTALRVDGKEADVFEYLRREFPYVHISAETKRRLLGKYRHQMKYIMSLVEPVESRKIKIRRQDVLKRQALLTDIMKQQKTHDDRFKQISDGKRREAKIRNMPRDSKISCLRAQRYVSSFQQQFQSRSAFNKSKEELLLAAVFEEMLEIQRSRLRSVRKLEKQSIDEFYDANGYTSDLNRVHQYYEANFRQLADMLSKERTDLTQAQKQQRKLNDRIRREFRDYMEADVRSLNDKIVNSWQPQHRELDADRVRNDLYEANWKFCVQ